MGGRVAPEGLTEHPKPHRLCGLSAALHRGLVVSSEVSAENCAPPKRGDPDGLRNREDEAIFLWDCTEA